MTPAEKLALKGLKKIERNYNDEALSLCEEALKLDLDCGLAWYGKGRSLLEMGDHENALSCLRAAAHRRPDVADVWLSITAALALLGQHEEAVAVCDRIIRLKPSSHDGWQNKSIALWRLGRNEEAIESINNSLALDPKHEPSLYVKGLILNSLNRAEEAVVLLTAVQKTYSNFPGYWLAMGSVLFNVGRFTESRAGFEQWQCLKVEGGVRSLALRKYDQWLTLPASGPTDDGLVAEFVEICKVAPSILALDGVTSFRFDLEQKHVLITCKASSDRAVKSSARELLGFLKKWRWHFRATSLDNQPFSSPSRHLGENPGMRIKPLFIYLVKDLLSPDPATKLSGALRLLTIAFILSAGGLNLPGRYGVYGAFAGTVCVMLVLVLLLEIHISKRFREFLSNKVAKR